MKQLNNQDAGFIYNESSNTPMHISGIGFYQKKDTGNTSLEHEDVVNYIQNRLHLTPTLRHRYIEVPLGLDKPYWIEDPDFDMDYHVRHLALPDLGTWKDFCQMIARVSAKPLDFNYPLWEIYVIEGLHHSEGQNKNSFAILYKVHHSLADGISGQNLFAAFHDLSEVAATPENPQPLTIERKPTAIELISRALPNLALAPYKQSAFAARTAPHFFKNILKLYRGEIQGGTHLRVPQTRFNHSLSSQRTFDAVTFPLADILKIKNTLQTTVNDVLLTVIAGGLRAYLHHHNELPKAPLSAMVPQNIRATANQGDAANQVGGLFTNLHTDIGNPIDRLYAIHTSSKHAKQLAQELNTAGIFQNYMGGFLNPSLGKRFNRLIHGTRVLERFGTLLCNTLITNVRGPDFPLYHAGAQMTHYFGIPPLTHCMGLGHAIFSYCDNLTITITADREMLKDPEFYADCINNAFEALLSESNKIKPLPKKAALPTEEKTTPVKNAEDPKPDPEEALKIPAPLKAKEVISQ